ncbi:PorP/SprF family type IX secretion system membrane protein [Pedobacter nutrimenti]|uniref:Type IX secretion system PorP/SprF family membrane protein n=1 Tax=Pedobacter nutrimenti TaxID=1241337 RepID=A0A318UHS8_9SPHI|nr:PorP/SprF family type IX secretion system membrane protein [Pedobacter nutrimenti]PYF74897.1 type IX secretion system PorP/SprF family membrane protein [Pedobacter nutrimenti]
MLSIKNSFPHIKLNKAISTLFVLLVMISTLQVKAQLNPFQAMYFQNPYLYNPAIAGREKGLVLNFGHNQQWNNFPGAPKISAMTAELQATERVGLGFQVNHDQAGLINSNRFMATYAYHLPLSHQGQHLSFGLSLGISDSRINSNNLNGDPTDEQVQRYNQLKPYLDGDLGIAYRSDGLQIGAALPNLKSTFFKTSESRFDTDRLLFIGSLSYKIHFQGTAQQLTLEPLGTYRIIKGYKDIVDAGFNFRMEDYGLNLQGIYHSSESMGIGFGLDKNSYAFNFAYNFETGTLGQYTNGTFELGLKLRLFNR